MTASPQYERDDESGSAIKSLTDRRQIIMMLMAAGWRNVDIAREFGLHPNYVSIMRTSPLFRAGIAEMQSRWRTGLEQDVMGMIEAETGASVKMLVEIRGESAAAHPGMANVQRQAANDLIALNPRFAPRRVAEVEHVHKIVLTRAHLEQMQRALPLSDPSGPTGMDSSAVGADDAS